VKPKAHEQISDNCVGRFAEHQQTLRMTQRSKVFHRSLIDASSSLATKIGPSVTEVAREGTNRQFAARQAPRQTVIAPRTARVLATRYRRARRQCVVALAASTAVTATACHSVSRRRSSRSRSNSHAISGLTTGRIPLTVSAHTNARQKVQGPTACRWER
jgi:hypothetical protein